MNFVDLFRYSHGLQGIEQQIRANLAVDLWEQHGHESTAEVIVARKQADHLEHTQAEMHAFLSDYIKDISNEQHAYHDSIVSKMQQLSQKFPIEVRLIIKEHLPHQMPEHIRANAINSIIDNRRENIEMYGVYMAWLSGSLFTERVIDQNFPKLSYEINKRRSDKEFELAQTLVFLLARLRPNRSDIERTILLDALIKGYTELADAISYVKANSAKQGLEHGWTSINVYWEVFNQYNNIRSQINGRLQWVS